MQTLRRTHVSLSVRDLDRSISFYRALFGVEPAKTRVGYAKFLSENPPLNLSLNLTPDASSGGSLSHLGIEVEGSAAVQEARERLAGLGLDTRVEEDVTCCYAVQDKVWVTDPDGNDWEFFTVLEDSEKRDEGSTCCPSPAAPKTDSCC